MMRFADHIVEVGPEAGAGGGHITFTGTYEELLQSSTLTGQWLTRRHRLRPNRQPTGWLKLAHVSRNNLQDVSVAFPKGVMTVVTGVAGSGKSSLVSALKKQLRGHYIDMTQSTITGNIRSTPATYTEILGTIRKRFAKANSVSATCFSYNGKKGACPFCKGKGGTITNMAFMDPVVQVCELCHGRRYNQQVLKYTYHDKNIADVLSMSVERADAFFAGDKEIEEPLNNLARVGLEYLKLDQPLSTLSGGELQRLKLAYELNESGQIYIFDEPTAGLHPQNTARLLKLFDQLVAAGNTLVVIEHNLDVISQTDYVIDVGPDAGVYGGQILFAGRPQDLLGAKTYTATALRKYLQANQ